MNEKKAQMLEAPISGGLEALKKGQMTVYIAGEKDVAEKVNVQEFNCTINNASNLLHCPFVIHTLDYALFPISTYVYERL